jgi:MurNAc alpha-1-phosphate uridylyltransferase
MVLAAGRGERMRPLTDRLPKPLIPVEGRPMIDRILDHLADAGVEHVVVNLNHLADVLERHLAGRTAPRIAFSREPERMETGGGVRRALPLLGDGPFFVLNADVVWLDGKTPVLERLAATWDDRTMDALLLVQPAARAPSYEGPGDFALCALGRLRRRREREIVPFVFAGIQILHPRLFAGAPEGAFSLNRLYDRAERAQRLAGLRHDGAWFHVGTAQQLAETEHAIAHYGAELF